MNQSESYSIRDQLLNKWVGYITQAAHTAQLTRQPIPLQTVYKIVGPRAGALNIRCTDLGGAGKLLKALSADDSANLRQLCPWDFTGHMGVFMSSRYLRVEAGWPDYIAERQVRLSDVGQHPVGGGRWIAGKNELGETVSLGLSDKTPHFLIGGQTGGGKSVAVQAAGLQLGQDYDNRLVLIDGKYGDGLKPLSKLPTLAGPMVTDVGGALAAMSWTCKDLRRRYENRGDPTRIVILWDEPQEWLNDSPALAEMTRLVLSQGRAVGVHVIMATHHPKVGMFGSGKEESSRGLVGRVALKVTDHHASRVVIGAPQPPAHRLLGAGDAYLVTPGAVHRAQLVFVDKLDFAALPSGEPILAEWPGYRLEDLGQALPSGFSSDEIGVSVLAAHQGVGRPKLRKMVDDETGSKPGGSRAQRLLELGRGVNEWLGGAGWSLCEGLTD